jgi:hypothetical protein
MRSKAGKPFVTIGPSAKHEAIAFASLPLVGKSTFGRLIAGHRLAVLRIILDMPRFARFLATIARFAIFMARVTVCGAAVSAMPQAAITVDAKSAESLLHAHGLDHHGHAWCLPKEIQLHSQLDVLERLEQRLGRSQQVVDQLLAQNDLFPQEMVRLEHVEKEARSRASASAVGSPQRAEFEAEAKTAAAKAEQCRRQYVRPPQLGMLPPLKFAMADLIAVRTDIMLRLLSMRREMDEFAMKVAFCRRLFQPARKNRLAPCKACMKNGSSLINCNRYFSAIPCRCLGKGNPIA